MSLKSFLTLASFTSLVSTLYIVFSEVPFQNISHTGSAVSSISAQELRDYILDKGTAETVPSLTFASVVTSRTQGVLGETDPADDSVPVAPTPFVTPLPQKKSYRVAILGDSMIDTLGPTLPHLRDALSSRYPDRSFELLNYGAGATDMEYGAKRLLDDYTYLGQPIKALIATHPDIIVIESFAYNHWANNQSDLDRQWLTIAGIIDTLKSRSPGTRIILAATIAPYCLTYTDGSANLPQPRKYEQCATVKAYLQNMVNFATSQGYPLANAYHASLTGEDGDPKYINQGDHIHPSEEGKKLFAEKVAQAISAFFN